MSNIFAFLDDDAITIPGIKSKAHPEGKDYRFESPDAATGAWLTALSDITVRLHRGLKVTEAETARLKLDDDQEVDFMRRVMGDTYQALVDDGVSWVRMQRIVQYLHVATTMGIDAADKMPDR